MKARVKYLRGQLQRPERGHAIATLTVPGPDSLAIHSKADGMYRSCRKEDAKTQGHEEYVCPEDAIDRIRCDGLSGRQRLVTVLMGDYERNQKQRKRKKRQWPRHQRDTGGHRRETRERQKTRIRFVDRGSVRESVCVSMCVCVRASNSPRGGGGEAIEQKRSIRIWRCLIGLLITRVAWRCGCIAGCVPINLAAGNPVSWRFFSVYAHTYTPSSVRHTSV